ncbi:RICIN domain-containing protein [Streptosporangiaceae bacterium NEAU-GS5]|nr:RICIN domain-containing protein [Streptosporangiaceae bacterium NEAU-GS5]
MKSMMRGCLVGALAVAAVPLGIGSTTANAGTSVMSSAAAKAAAAPIRIENRRSGKCLEVARTGFAPPLTSGARVDQFTCQTGADHSFAVNNNDRAGAQRWTLFLEEIGPNGSFYSFRVALSGQCLEVNQTGRTQGLGNNAFLVQMPCNHSFQQQWRQFSLGNGFFQFQNRRSNRCLEVDQADGSAGLGSGTRVIQFRCHGGAQQQWRAR